MGRTDSHPSWKFCHHSKTGSHGVIPCCPRHSDATWRPVVAVRSAQCAAAAGGMLIGLSATAHGLNEKPHTRLARLTPPDGSLQHGGTTHTKHFWWLGEFRC